jgi:hypothetical protein
MILRPWGCDNGTHTSNLLTLIVKTCRVRVASPVRPRSAAFVPLCGTRPAPSLMACRVDAAQRRIRDALLHKPSIQLFEALDPQSRREKPLAHKPTLVLDLSLLPARCWCARNWINQIMAAHLRKAPIIGALTTDKNYINCSLHIVVDAARACAFEKSKCAAMRVEHHLLRLTRIRTHKQHPAVAQPDMCDFHRHRGAVDPFDHMAPVELIRLARRKTQRHISSNRGRCEVTLPCACISPHRIVAARVPRASTYWVGALSCVYVIEILRCLCDGTGGGEFDG